jgi:hypothetical protein
MTTCERCGEVNPAEIHTCTPKGEEGCAECGKKSSDGWALYCVKCSEREWQEPVAVWELQEGGWDTIADRDWMESLPIGTKLYTAPPQRECKCKHCGGINVC